MDWSSNDYTQTFADTIYVPEPEADTGIYLLDEAGSPAPGDRFGPGDLHNDDDSRVRAPIRPYGGPRGKNRPSGRYGTPVRRSHPGTPYNAYRAREGFGGREGYYTGGNIDNSYRDQENNHAIFDVAWDERPMHYNPNAGADWAHLVPSPQQRPYGGGPAPSLAFPMISNSEAQVSPKDLFTNGSSASAGVDQAVKNAQAAIASAVFRMILMVVVVVLLAMLLVSVGRLAGSLKKAIASIAELNRALRAESPQGALAK